MKNKLESWGSDGTGEMESLKVKFEGGKPLFVGWLTTFRNGHGDPRSGGRLGRRAPSSFLELVDMRSTKIMERCGGSHVERGSF